MRDKDANNLLDMYLNTREKGFGDEVKRRILVGNYVLSAGHKDAYYNKAVAVRGIIRNEIETVLQTYDAIVTPTTPTPAFTIGEKAHDPVAMYLSDLFTVPANIAQHPAITIPSGKSATGLPFGFQCIGARFAESSLFELGTIIETIATTASKNM